MKLQQIMREHPVSIKMPNCQIRVMNRQKVRVSPNSHRMKIVIGVAEASGKGIRKSFSKGRRLIYVLVGILLVVTIAQSWVGVLPNLVNIGGTGLWYVTAFLLGTAVNLW